jgi:glutamine amidotransferase
VNKLPQDGYPLPHMGWNKLIMKQPEHFLLNGITQLDHLYFVHSFAAPVVKHTVASCIYGVEFSAIVAKGNFYGTQFHPERSGKVGSMILNNFLQCG